MSERSVLIRIAVKDADAAIKELEKVGIRGEQAIERLLGGGASLAANLGRVDGFRNLILERA